MFEREESRHDLAFMAGVIVGAISGALTALALTPMSGAETREKLRETSSNLGPVKEKVTTTASQAVAPVKEKAAEAVSAASQAVGPMKDKAAEMAAKSPLPMGNKQDEQDIVMSEDVARDEVDHAADAARDAGEAVHDAAKDAAHKVDEKTDRPAS